MADDAIWKIKLVLEANKALRQLQDFKSEWKDFEDLAEMGLNSKSSEETAKIIKRVEEYAETARDEVQKLEDKLRELKEEQDALDVHNPDKIWTDEEVELADKLDSEIHEINEKLKDQKSILSDTSDLEQRLIKVGEIQEKLENIDAKKGVNATNNAFGGLMKTVKRFGMAMLGIRGAFTAIRKAMSSYLSYNDDTAQKLQNVWKVLGASIGPIVDWIATKINQLASYINYFIKMLTGVDVVAQANAKALNKQAQAQGKLNKTMRQSASFDEQNKLSDTSSGGGSAGGGGGIELPEVPEEVAKRLEKLANVLKPIWKLVYNIGKFILDNWEAILLAILAFNIVKWIGELGSLKTALDTFLKFLSGNWVAILIGLLVFLAVEIYKHWDEIVAWYHEKVEPWLGPVIEKVGGVFHEVGEWLNKGWQFCQKLLQSIFGDAEVDFGSGGANMIGGLLSGLLKGMLGIGTWIWEHIVKPIIDAFCKLFGIHSPSTVFEGFGKNIIEGLLQGLQNTWKNITTFFSNGIKWITDKFTLLKEWFSSKVQSVVSVFGRIWEGIKETFRPVTQWFSEKFGGAWEKVKKVFSGDSETFKGIKEGISSVFKGIVNKLIGGINAVIAWPFNKINSALNKVREASFLGIQPFKDKWGYNPIYVPQIPYLAKGGIAVRPTQAVIGEAGKEAVLPLENNLEWMDKLADKIASNIVIEAMPLNVDGKKIAQIVFKQKSQMQFVNNRGY